MKTVVVCALLLSLIQAVQGDATQNETIVLLEEGQCVDMTHHHCNDSLPTSNDSSRTCLPISAAYFQLASTDEVVQCVDCFFPNHCLDGNNCSEGTAGATCERCLTKLEDPQGNGFISVGSLCVACRYMVPWPLVLLTLFIIIIIIGIAKNGFTVSVYTKLKIGVNFLQLLLLTVNVRTSWPPWMGYVFMPMLFIHLNSRLLLLECYLPVSIPLHYFTWGSTVLLLLLVLLVILLLDRRMSKVVRKIGSCEESVKLWRRRSTLRRAGFLLFLTCYTPLAISAVHTYACSSSIPQSMTYGSSEEDIFLYDQSMDCEDFPFQVLNVACGLCFIAFVVAGPAVLMFVTIRNRKWDLLDSHSPLYGSMYETYTKRWCFWEAIPLLHKLLFVALTEVYPFVLLVQMLTMVVATGVYTILVALLRPYRKYTWRGRLSIHNALEVLASLSVCLLQLCALLREIIGSAYPEPLDFLAIAVAVLVILIWVVVFLHTHKEMAVDQVEVIQAVQSDPGKPSVTNFWHRSEDGEGVDANELDHRRKDVLNF